MELKINQIIIIIEIYVFHLIKGIQTMNLWRTRVSKESKKSNKREMKKRETPKINEEFIIVIKS